MLFDKTSYGKKALLNIILEIDPKMDPFHN